MVRQNHPCRKSLFAKPGFVNVLMGKRGGGKSERRDRVPDETGNQQECNDALNELHTE
jgi:hypothetical protein